MTRAAFGAFVTVTFTEREKSHPKKRATIILKGLLQA